MRKHTRRGLLLGSALLLVAGCGTQKTERGWDYFPDMYDSPAYRSQQAQVVTVDGKVHHVGMMMPPPEGTVPRDFLPYQFHPRAGAAPEEITAAADAAAKIPNPLAPTTAVLKEGQWAFNTYCAVCHGNTGNATDGYVAYKFSGIPSLNGANLQAMSDGAIYHIVTNGRNRMPNYRAQLLPNQRWAAIHYLRVLNRATVARTDTAAALKAAEDDAAKKPDDAAAKKALADARAVQAQAERDLQGILAGGSGAGFLPPAQPVPEYERPNWPEAAQ